MGNVDLQDYFSGWIGESVVQIDCTKCNRMDTWIDFEAEEYFYKIGWRATQKN